jgi:hypothetical protein
MPEQDIAEFLSNRIDCLEMRFETRFDRLEARLDRWMEKNGKQNVSIQKNADKIAALYKRIERRSKRLLTISVAIASCIATLLTAFIQIVIKRIF